MRAVLVEKRMLAGLSISDMAKALKVSESTIRKVEAGTRTPSIKLAYRWRKKLKIPQKDFLAIFFNNQLDIM